MTAEIPRAVARAKSSLVTRLRNEPWFVGAGLSHTAEQWRIVVIVNEDAARDSAPTEQDGVPVEVRVGGTASPYG